MNENEREWERMRENEREWERGGTIGLDWLGIGWREGGRGGRGKGASLIFSASLSPHSIPHSSPP